ncbi:MAG: RNA polymerase sigma factor [Anaerolineae bacterium]
MEANAVGKSDLDLISQAQGGSLMAFNVLVSRYQPLVFNVAYRLTGDGEAAADASQEAFILAYRKLGQFRGGSFRAWLARIATNCSYDSLRAKQRRRTTSIDEMVEEEERCPELVNGTHSPEEYALASELSGAINGAIGCLPPDQRAVLVLVDISGFDYDEAAAALDCSLGTVKSRLSRARAKVREALMAHPELLPSSFRL